MLILLFDMDGVLLEPQGYHRGLQETVRRVGLSLGFSGVHLTDQQIARFEALAITNEWHSGSVSLAVLVMEKMRQGQPPQISDSLPAVPESLTPFELQLDDYFTILSDLPVTMPARERAAAAVEVLANRLDLPPQLPTSIVLNSQDIALSPTLNVFQELVLGSETFQQIYSKPSRMEQISYLTLFDKPLLSDKHLKRLAEWRKEPQHGAAILTNRPSNSLLGNTATPEAENGARLVGLEGLPLVGSGEMVWLSERINRPEGELVKPNPEHAVAAILAATGMPLAESVTLAGSNGHSPPLQFLDGSTVIIFEDSPGGFIAVDRAAAAMRQWGLSLTVVKIGVTRDEAKRTALSEAGAGVVTSINDALDNLEGF